MFISYTQIHAQNTDSKLVKVIINFRTHDDNKDHDTKLYVKIKNKVTLFLSKEIAQGDDLGGDMEFNDPSNHSFDLVLTSSNIKASELTAPFVTIGIQPNGNDRWIFDYTVKLEFSDGSTYTTDSQGTILDQNNRNYEGIFKS
ncbi:hypothetical protein SAMN05661012_06575 [Chitinophaga sancti]|uniref:PLAT domain-containing protein n=1 Tax=Chitinophaga sancti TaxID=1004 RepID=A0A1K1T184_9BACT|nr:hypothetical protein SAMN05661012_06575 [Chitinophaga sancti]